MGDFNWLHFSDLHLAPEDGFDSEYAKRQLLKFLEDETAAGHLPCDYIFITGDIANKNDYTGVEDFITKLLKALAWSNEKSDKIFWAVGNHDISSRKNKHRQSAITEILRKKENSERLFEEWMKDPEYIELLVTKGMKDYSDWYKILFKKEIYTSDKYPHIRYDLPDLNLFVLNTCLASCDDYDEHNIYLVDSSILKLFKDNDISNPTFVIGHHGYEFFTRNTSKRFERMLNTGNVNLYLCGHSHELGLCEFQKTDRENIFQITSGGCKQDDNYVLSFIHGHYNSINKEVNINPCTYAEHGDQNWHFDKTFLPKRYRDSPIKLDNTKNTPVIESKSKNVDGIATKGNEPVFPITVIDTVNNESINYGFPARNRFFVGRDNMMDNIQRGLESTSAVVIKGAGGFGKTQMAVEYAYRHAGDYKTIWSFNAESENGVMDSYRNFAVRNLSMANAMGDNFELIKKAVDNWFEKNSSFLLIYDNAEGCENIAEYLPHKLKNRHVIICSRENIGGIDAEWLDAEKFPINDAIELIKKRIPTANDEDANELAHELDCLPLALECAAAYVIENKYTSLNQYLSEWRRHKTKLLVSLPQTDNYNQTVLTTWQTTFTRITEITEKDELTKAALQLFRLCAYCAPDDIPLRLFINGRNETLKPLLDYLDPEDSPNHAKLLGVLIRYSLISFHRDAETSEIFISIHRLIQEIMNIDFDNHIEWVNCILNIVVSNINYEYGLRNDFDNFTNKLQHIIKIISWCDQKLHDDDLKIKITKIYRELGIGFLKQCEYEKALEWFNKALKIHENVLGKNHPNTATTYNDIAQVYNNQGQYEKALEWYLKDLTINENILGKDHPDTAKTYNNIALVYDDQGNYDKALEWYYKALVIIEKVYGREHPDTVAIYNNIAIVYKNQGDFEKSLEWHYKNLVVRENLFGNEHLETAQTYNNIACVYDNLVKYEKALEWYDKALVIREKVLGKDHPDTAAIYNNIAVVHNNQGNYKKALELYKNILAIHIKTFGNDHPDTAVTYNNIASVYLKAEKIIEARTLFCRAVIIFDMCNLSNHPNRKLSYNALCDSYEKAGGNVEEFEPWFDERVRTYPAWCDDIIDHLVNP